MRVLSGGDGVPAWPSSPSATPPIRADSARIILAAVDAVAAAKNGLPTHAEVLAACESCVSTRWPSSSANMLVRQQLKALT
jgi:hypothetical protein